MFKLLLGNINCILNIFLNILIFFLLRVMINVFFIGIWLIFMYIEKFISVFEIECLIVFMVLNNYFSRFFWGLLFFKVINLVFLFERLYGEVLSNNS